MSERLALKAGYELRHTTEVPVGIEKTDTVFTTNLVVGF
jgi:putative salt-induced outer membrane protein YdiY